MAAAASSTVRTANRPRPHGKCELNPVSCTTAGRPLAICQPGRPMKSPVLFATKTFLHTAKSPRDERMYRQYESRFTETSSASQTRHPEWRSKSSASRGARETAISMGMFVRRGSVMNFGNSRSFCPYVFPLNVTYLFVRHHMTDVDAPSPVCGSNRTESTVIGQKIFPHVLPAVGLGERSVPILWPVV